MLEFYTDGACSGNGKEEAIGGYGWVCLKDGVLWQEYKSSQFYKTTNQRMELQAAIDACTIAQEFIQENGFCDVIIYTDSAYLVNCIEQNWWKAWEKNGWVNSKKQPVANILYWKALLPYFRNNMFTFKKVSGHSGNEWNEYVDRLAVRAREGK